MKLLLLTNDDGANAPGLQALPAASEGLEERVIVAPQRARSGRSHPVTTDRPMRIERREESRYALDGSPADCVRVTPRRVAPDAARALPGINAGCNLGEDVYLSGAVAAVREATLHGFPGIALSQRRRKDVPIPWERTAEWAAPILADLMRRPPEEGVCRNANFPCMEPDAPRPEIEYRRLDPSPLPLSYFEESGEMIFDGAGRKRQRKPGTDADVCATEARSPSRRSGCWAERDGGEGQIRDEDSGDVRPSSL
jgi:5'-nucleotidase